MPVHRNYRVDRNAVRIGKDGWAQHGRGCGPRGRWRIMRAGLPWTVAEDRALLRAHSLLAREGLQGERLFEALRCLHSRPKLAMQTRFASIRAGLRIASVAADSSSGAALLVTKTLT